MNFTISDNAKFKSMITEDVKDKIVEKVAIDFEGEKVEEIEVMQVFVNPLMVSISVTIEGIGFMTTLKKGEDL